MAIALIFLLFVTTVASHWSWTGPNSSTMPVLVRAHTMPYLRSRNRFASATATGLPQQYYPARRQTAFTRSILAGGALPVLTTVTAANQPHHTMTIATNTDASDGVITTENPIKPSVPSANKQIESGVKPSIVRPGMGPSVNKGPQEESGNKIRPTSMPPVHKDEKEDEVEDEDNEEGMNEEEDGDSCGDYDSESDDDDDDEDEDNEDDEYDEGDDVRVASKRPNVRRGNKSRKRYFPRLNNLFPVIFSLPRASKGRRGSSSTFQVPRLIAAVANSYSTARGGIASSVATAYGLPTARPRRKLLKNRTKAGRTH